MTTHAQLTEQDRAAIAATMRRLAEAWNSGDAAAYGAEFTTDASYVSFNGDIMSGREEIAQVHRFLFEGPLRGSRMESSGQPPIARPIHPGVAVVLNGGGARLAEDTELTADRDSIASLVLVEEPPGQWRVAAFHNTRRFPGHKG